MSGIVVGIDGSGHSERTLEWAAREAALRQVPLTVVVVHQPLVGYWAGAEYPLGHALAEWDSKAASGQVAKILARVGAGTLPQVTVDVASGSSAEKLLTASRDADLLVVGTRGSGGLAQLVSRPVSSQGACQAHCTVVVIPAEDQ